MRKFYIQSNNGLRYDLQNKNKCFLNNPEGLGFEKDNKYTEVGNYYELDNSKNVQKTISGELVFVNDWYSNYNEFVTFIKSYDEYKLVYDYNNILYFIDVDIISVSKGDTKGQKYLSCDLQMKAKSLWYKTNSIIVEAEQSETTAKWDFQFDLRFNDIVFNNIQIENNGQVKTPFEIEIEGSITNPKVELYQNGVKINELLFSITLTSGQKLLYGNVDNDLYVLKDTGTNIINAFDSLSLLNNNWFKLPIGYSSLSISSETGIISKAKITYYEEFEAV